jgi:hypothetical protein
MTDEELARHLQQQDEEAYADGERHAQTLFMASLQWSTECNDIHVDPAAAR